MVALYLAPCLGKEVAIAPRPASVRGESLEAQKLVIPFPRPYSRRGVGRLADITSASELGSQAQVPRALQGPAIEGLSLGKSQHPRDSWIGFTAPLCLSLAVSIGHYP